MDNNIIGVIAAGAAAAGAAVGTVGNRIVERLMPSTDKRVDELQVFRIELAERLDRVQKELDEWKLKYFDLLGLYHDLQIKHENDHRELETLKNRVTRNTRTVTRTVTRQGGRMNRPRKGGKE